MSIDKAAFVHWRSTLIGDITLGPHASVWPNAVLRADSAAIVIGTASNIQDSCVLHVDPGMPVTIGDRVAVGHGAIIHGATVESDVLVGMGAILQNGVHVGSGSIVAPGAVCPEDMRIPPNSVVMGVPGRVMRQTTPEERDRISRTVSAYLALQDAHRAGRYKLHG